MKRNIITAILLAAFILPYTAKADEGMWLLAYLDKNYKDMKAKGLKLTPKQLYDVNQACTKDAIGWFGGGCTSEIISSKGLVLTNHHCGYSAIAGLSSTSDNILDNGFWAKSMNEERSAKDISLAIVQRMDDITLFITSQLKGVAEKDRASVLAKIYTR
ncbi:MAG: S46 family peptidase, partial [Bacteroidia bacterium]|nr:S46 family peptidase [Bacteroidia bacterium]